MQHVFYYMLYKTDLVYETFIIDVCVYMYIYRITFKDPGTLLNALHGLSHNNYIEKSTVII